MTNTSVPVTGAVTTRFAGAVGKKFAWSFSRLKNFEQCPKRHYEIDIAKTSKDVGGAALEWGNLVHDAMRDRLVKKTQLPIEMVDYEFHAKKVEAALAHATRPLQVEQKYAITREFTPTGYFAPDVWYRGIADALVIAGPVALVIDWKTGKIQEDSVQLALMAQCVFSFFPEVQAVAAKYAWLKEHAETVERFSRADMVRIWPSLLARVALMEQASVNMSYPPTPNYLCQKFCPVVSCPFHGKDNRK